MEFYGEAIVMGGGSVNAAKFTSDGSVTLTVERVVMPAMHGFDLGMHWTHLTSLLGVGGIAVAAGTFMLRGGRPVPVKDPFLEDSLRYVQP